MKTVQPARWMEGVGPGDRVADAAWQTLRLRLEAVRDWLPLAAWRAEEDVEYVHQLRVAARRAAAALDLYAAFLPRRAAERVAQDLTRVRRAAGKARDCDVLLRRWSKGHPEAEASGALDDLRRRRARAQRSIQAANRRLGCNHRFRRHLGALLAGVRPRGREADILERVTFGDWARGRLASLVTAFFRAEPSAGADLAALHQFRIRGKELRYALEALAPAFPPALRTDVYPVVTELQDRLGSLNDRVVAVGRLVRRLKGAGDAATDALRSLLDREKASLERRRRDFADWWAGHGGAALRSGFAELLGQGQEGGSWAPRWATVGRE